MAQERLDVKILAFRVGQRSGGAQPSRFVLARKNSETARSPCPYEDDSAAVQAKRFSSKKPAS